MHTHTVGASLKRFLLAGLVVVVAHPAAAQGIAHNFEQLELLVRVGDTVSVTDDSGHEVTGRIADLTATTLVFDLNGQRREWGEQDVLRIRQRRGDSLGNGAAIGLAVGVGLTVAAVAASDEGFNAEAGMAVALYAGIGAGIGAGIDALIQKRQVIFERRPGGSAQISLAPILSATCKGALVSVRF